MSMKRIAVCANGISPAFIADTAIPAMVCVWMTQSTSCRARWMALWMMKPALLMSYSVGLKRILPSRSSLMKHEAVRGGEIDALRPFGCADLFLDRLLLLDAGDAHDVLLARESDAA